MARLQLPSVDRIPGGRGFASLSRRVRTLIVTAILFLVMFILALTLPVPYVILSPGPTYNTLGTDTSGNVIITIDGKTSNKTTGNLNMTTVSVTSQPISAFQAIAGWLISDEVVVPRSSVYTPGQTQQQTDQQNTQDFITSQDSAKVAALCELGYPKGFGVVSVLANGPSHGVLLPGDQLVSVAGKPANTAAKLTAVLQAQKPGTKVPVVVKRQTKGSGQTKTASLEVTLTTPPKGAKGARLGIEVSDTCLAPFTVDLGLANQIGGPSAGLMFALGIMDKVGTTDLTKGRFIAGTGTIDPAGKVGPIGGIALKMIAAKSKGASVFLAPAGNCADVVKDTPAGLKVVKVDTLHHAVQDLLKIEQGQAVPGC
ncbi:MAG: Lon-like protease [Pseudonocardiales bacterium]|nr:Lon-like protease [Pseudonocardiales bacterium]MDT4930265.1 Lon-like protease [Pseudonocardiales bacterium]